MKELYKSPKAEVLEFDAMDVITTSGLEDFQEASVTSEDGWTGLY